MVRVVFYWPAGGLRAELLPVFAIVLCEDQMAYFGPPESANECEWDHSEDDWAAQRPQARLRTRDRKLGASIALPSRRSG